MSEHTQFISSSRQEEGDGENVSTFRYSVKLDPRFSIKLSSHGGYMMAMVLDATIDAFARSPNSGTYPDPLSQTCYFISAPPVDTVYITVRTYADIRTKSMAYYEGELQSVINNKNNNNSSDNQKKPRKKTCLKFQGYFGDFTKMTPNPFPKIREGNPVLRAIESPHVLDQSKCFNLPPRDTLPSERLSIDGAPSQQDASRQPPLRRFVLESRFYNPASLKNGAYEVFDRSRLHPTSLVFFPMFLDSLPPLVLVMENAEELAEKGQMPWFPTLEMTIYFRASRAKVASLLRPQSYVRLNNVGHAVDKETGLWEADCNLYSESNELLANSRQLMRIVSALPPAKASKL